MNRPCDLSGARVESLLAGQISDPEFARLLKHASSCRQCRSLLLVHLQLADAEMIGPAAPEEDMRLLRRRVVGVLREAPAASSPQRLMRPGLYRVAAGLAAAAAGLVVGWLLFAGSTDSALIEHLSAEAAGNRRLADSTESPYILSNISLREADRERVTVDFDVTTHLEVTRSWTDPLVQEVLVQAMLEPASAGESLEALRHSRRLLDSRIKEGILFAARFDANSGVRLRALQTAMAAGEDPDVQKVCLEILDSDDSVQMRLLAVDYLADTREGSSLLRRFIEQAPPDLNAAVRMRASHYLQ